MSETLSLELAGEIVTARAAKTLWWPREKTLLVADIHLGKAAAFRARGFGVPVEANAGELPRLREEIEALNAARLVILGDLWHARQGRTPEELERFRVWRESVPECEIWLIEGNHDRHAGPLPEGLNVREWPENTPLGPFVLRHHPEPAPDGYVLAGHLHPGITMSGRGGERLRLPCFWFGPQVGVLPSFGGLTGTAGVPAKVTDTVLAVVENALISVAAPTPFPRPENHIT